MKTFILLCVAITSSLFAQSTKYNDVDPFLGRWTGPEKMDTQLSRKVTPLILFRSHVI